MGKLWDQHSVADILPHEEVLTIRPDMESIDGHPCYVLESKGRYGEHTLWFDPEYDYIIRRAQVHKEGDDLYWGYLTVAELDVSSTDWTFNVVEVKQVEGLWIPMHGRLQSTDTRTVDSHPHIRYRKKTLTKHVRLERLEFERSSVLIEMDTSDMPADLFVDDANAPFIPSKPEKE